MPILATLPAMARRLRVAAGGVVYHVLNRAVGRNRILDDEGDYLAFEKVLLQAHEHSGLPVCREEPVRAGLSTKAAGWRWSSAAGGGSPSAKPWLTPRDQWPVPAPSDWTRWVNLPGNQKELEALCRSVTRGAPFGEDGWVRRTAGRLRLESSLRDPHRPKRRKESGEKDS